MKFGRGTEAELKKQGISFGVHPKLRIAPLNEGIRSAEDILRVGFKTRKVHLMFTLAEFLIES